MNRGEIKNVQKASKVFLAALLLLATGFMLSSTVSSPVEVSGVDTSGANDGGNGGGPRSS